MMDILKFKNPELTEKLFKEGKIIVPFLNQDDIEVLKSIFADSHSDLPQGFYSTTHAENKEWRKEISDQILEVIKEKILTHFENIQLLGGAFISKAPGEKGILPLHQDWNIVNEKEARSYNLWIPLVDVNEQNGAMRILEESHLKQETYRGPNLSPVLYQISKEVDQEMVSVNMKAGNGLVYDHALWHSSPINQSSDLRLAIVFGIIPEGVEMKFYHQNGEFIEEYASHPNFFFENDPKDGPKGLKKLRNIEFKNQALDLKSFQSLYLSREEKKTGGLLKFFGLKK